MKTTTHFCWRRRGSGLRCGVFRIASAEGKHHDGPGVHEGQQAMLRELLERRGQ